MKNHFWTPYTIAISRNVITCVWILLLFYCQPSNSQDHKQASKKFITIELPLLINNAYVGDISASVDPLNQNIEATLIDRKRLLELFENFSSEKQQQQWFAPFTSLTKIAIFDLQQQGLDIHYQPESLQISAKIIKDGTTFLSLSRRTPPDPQTFEPLAKFAAGLNIEFEPSYQHSGSNQGLAPLEADFSGFISTGQFNAWSLLFETNYLEDDKHEFSRGDLTLLHNNFKHAVRYALGDIRPSVSRFQSAIDLAGLSIERDYQQINPFRNLRPNGRNTFTLEQDSTVTFEVNGTVVLIQELPAGSFSVSDFPLITGNNDVTIIVDDGKTSQEISQFSTFVDTSLLAKGFTNFGINVGFPVDPESSTRKPDYLEDPVALAFWEKGISDRLTLGVQLELAEHHQLLAGSYILGTKVGSWAIEAAASERDDLGSGFSGLVQYDLEPQAKIGDWSTQLDLQYRYQSDDFISLGQRQSSVQEHAFTSRFRLQKKGISLSLSGDFRKTNERETKTITLNTSYSFANFSLSMGLQYRDDNERGSDERFNINFSKKLGKKHRYRARYNSNENDFSTELRNTNGNNVGDLFYQISYDQSDSDQGGDLNFRYIQPRFEVDASHRTIENTQRNTRSSQTDLNLATSIGFADGHVSFGRPFRNGFIILNRHANLKGKPVHIRKGTFSDKNFTSTQWFNSILIPIDSSYRRNTFRVDVDNLPIGYDIGGGEIKIFPNQTPAYVYPLGSENSNILIGKLFYEDQSPVQLASGTLLPITSDKADTNITEIAFFTNRTGRFVAEKIAPGKYQIQLSDGNIVGEIFVEKPKEPGLIDIGNIILENSDAK